MEKRPSDQCKHDPTEGKAKEAAKTQKGRSETVYANNVQLSGYLYILFESRFSGPFIPNG